MMPDRERQHRRNSFREEFDASGDGRQDGPPSAHSSHHFNSHTSFGSFRPSQDTEAARHLQQQRHYTGGGSRERNVITYQPESRLATGGFRNHAHQYDNNGAGQRGGRSRQNVYSSRPHSANGYGSFYESETDAVPRVHQNRPYAGFSDRYHAGSTSHTGFSDRYHAGSTSHTGFSDRYHAGSTSHVSDSGRREWTAPQSGFRPIYRPHNRENNRRPFQHTTEAGYEQKNAVPKYDNEVLPGNFPRQKRVRPDSYRAARPESYWTDNHYASFPSGSVENVSEKGQNGAYKSFDPSPRGSSDKTRKTSSKENPEFTVGSDKTKVNDPEKDTLIKSATAAATNEVSKIEASGKSSRMDGEGTQQPQADGDAEAEKNAATIVPLVDAYLPLDTSQLRLELIRKLQFALTTRNEELDHLRSKHERLHREMYAIQERGTLLQASNDATNTADKTKRDPANPVEGSDTKNTGDLPRNTFDATSTSEPHKETLDEVFRLQKQIESLNAELATLKNQVSVYLSEDCDVIELFQDETQALLQHTEYLQSIPGILNVGLAMAKNKRILTAIGELFGRFFGVYSENNRHGEHNRGGESDNMSIQEIPGHIEKEKETSVKHEGSDYPRTQKIGEVARKVELFMSGTVKALEVEIERLQKSTSENSQRRRLGDNEKQVTPTGSPPEASNGENHVVSSETTNTMDIAQMGNGPNGNDQLSTWSGCSPEHLAAALTITRMQRDELYKLYVETLRSFQDVVFSTGDGEQSFATAISEKRAIEGVVEKLLNCLAIKQSRSQPVPAAKSSEGETNEEGNKSPLAVSLPTTASVFSTKTDHKGQFLEKQHDSSSTKSPGTVGGGTRDTSSGGEILEDHGKTKRRRKARSAKSDVSPETLYEVLRAKTLCPLCHERWKDAALKVCGHTFCEKCIKSSLETRNRKCPQCHTRCQVADVIKIYVI